MKNSSLLRLFLSTFLFIFLSTSAVWADIDWSIYSWIDKNQCDMSCYNKYKINSTANPNPVNIQYFDNNTRLGIYISFTSAISSCSLSAGDYTIQGAGMWIALTAITAEETPITVTCNDGIYNFVVYYADGIAPTVTRTYDGEEKMYFLRDAWDWWNNSSPKFFAYFWNSGTGEYAWSGEATSITTTADSKVVYGYTVPEGTWEKVIITRHPSSTTTPTFDDAYNKSNDI